MKATQLVLFGALGIVAASSASAQQAMYGYPAGAMGGPYAGAQAASYMQPMGPQMGGYPAYPQTGYPPAAPGGYAMAPQMDPQQALYGPATPMNGDPPSYGDGSCMSCGADGGCGCGPNAARCYDDGTAHYAYGSAEIFYARRDNAVISQPTIIDATTGATLASTTDLSFIYLPGAKIQAGYFFSNGWGVESDFWGQWGFSDFKSVSEPGNLAIPGDLGVAGRANFFNVDQITEIYSSHINNYEINFILPYASVQYLAGFRYLSIDERFDINTFSNATGSGDYQIVSHNRMYGGQLGARTQWQVERFVFDFEGKAGVFANSAHQDQTVVGDTDGVLRQTGASERQAAFVGEVSAYLFIPMGTHFTGRLGYTAIWIDDLALAPDQLDFTDTTTSGTGIYTRGSMLIHGFNAGLEARW
jgi:Putative beta barrel porin-7 (BBP7)